MQVKCVKQPLVFIDFRGVFVMYVNENNALKSSKNMAVLTTLLQLEKQSYNQSPQKDFKISQNSASVFHIILVCNWFAKVPEPIICGRHLLKQRRFFIILRKGVYILSKQALDNFF